MRIFFFSRKKTQNKRKNLAFSFEKIQKYVRIMTNNYFNIFFMQNYTKIQKFLSFLLIFSILFSFSFHITFFSFLGTIFASDNKNYNVVSIFVQEEIYSWVKASVDRYARNIQSVLENTKTMIIPIPGDTHPFNITSLNEKLYFEWYEGLDGLSGNSKLIGSIFIWDLALPVVENKGSYEKTVFPYVDFEEKLYIYNEINQIFQINPNSIKTPKAEIWHGFISPNTGNRTEDIAEINAYFSKNNDFYSGNGLFQNSKNIMNGNLEEELLSSYEPHVFYYDQIRETKAVKYVDYKAYESTLENMEDLSYNRFSAQLAEKLKKNYFWAQSDYIWDIGSIFWSGIDMSSMLLWPTTQNIPDIQTRHIINKTTKKFIEIFNESALWEMRKNVHNAGRYNSWSNQVNVDLIPTLVTSLDTLSQKSVKNVNTDLEKIIDSVVKKGLSRNIAIPSTFEMGSGTYINFLYGMQGANIKNAQECSFYRGSTYNSGNLVGANRAFNINNVEPDVGLCRNADTRGYWWGNSPLNLDTENSVNGEIWKLKFSDPTLAIVPLFDIVGGLKTTDISKNPDPRMCFNNNLLLTKVEWSAWEWGFWENSYSVPVNGNPAINWNCSTTNKKFPYTYSFDETYKMFPVFPNLACEENYLLLDGKVVKTHIVACGEWWSGWGNSGESWTQTGSTINNYNFHKISSWIEHKAPNNQDVYKQAQYMISPNLPIDKDRYIDFIAADNTYGKIEYPYLFRVSSPESFDFAATKRALKQYLDQKSQEINALIQTKDPSKLSGEDLKIYQLLTTGPYPQANIDLYAILSAKPNKEVEILGEKKTLSYIDTVTFSILWNNLTSVSAKYAFIFENYLSDQFWGNDYNFYLPKNKKQYEIAYLWAPGDPRNMYIKLDPEENGENPYTSIIAANQNLDSYLLSIKENNDETLFKCAPPEWVPIWKWIPAIICRLQDMLPPKISIWEWNCWLPAMNFWDDGEIEVCTSCQTTQTWSQIPGDDFNKNGIPDFLEKEVKKADLEFSSNSTKYPYNKTGFLQASLKNQSGALLSYDSYSNITFELVKLEAPLDQEKEFTQSNRQTLFDKNVTNLSTPEAKSKAESYISFADMEVRLNRGAFKYNFSTKAKDADVTLRAILELKAYNWSIIESKTKEIKIEIRWDLFYTSTYKLWKFDGELSLDSFSDWVVVSESPNIYLIEEKDFFTLKSNLSNLDNLSLAKEKMFLSLDYKDKKGNSVAISYPLSVKIFNLKWELAVDPILITTLDSPKSLWKFKEAWVYHIEIKDSKWFIIKKQISFLPDTAVKIEPKLSTNLMEKGGVITTHVFSIYDQFENPAQGEIYTVEAEIDWGSVVFEDGSKKQTFQLYDGYKAFRLKTTPLSWNANITFSLKKAEKTLDKKTLPLLVVDKIDFDIIVPNELQVGNKKYNYTLQVKNISEKSMFNSRAYLINNSDSIKTIDNYIEIKNSLGTGSFQTRTKAWEKIKLEFKIEWIKDSVYKEINITPDVGLKISLTLSKPKMEANPASNATLYAEIKDRYNNVVWNDNQTVLDLEILNKYSQVITTNTSTKQVQKWKVSFILSGTNIPGSAYFKVGSTPSLWENSFTIDGQRPFPKETLDSFSGMRESGVLTPLGKLFFTDYDTKNYRFKYYDSSILQASEDFRNQNPLIQNKLLALFEENNTITINGVGENVGKIETFYFWNKSKIDGKKYNSIYTTLLWSNYWDLTVSDNLANSLIFDENNKSLWVTTLLSDVSKHQEILNLQPNGNLAFQSASSDIARDISSKVNTSENGGLEVVVYNNTLWLLVSKIYYHLRNPKILDRCASSNISDCFEKEKSTVILTSLWAGYTSKADERTGVKLTDSENQTLVEISPNGSIKKSLDVTFELLKDAKKWLVLHIKKSHQTIGVLALSFGKSNVKIIRDMSLFDEVKDSQSSGGIIMYLEARDYFYKTKYLWSSTKEDIGYVIAYNDPFASNNSWVNQFGTFFNFWYEKFSSKDGLGWKEDNKILLSFAAGKNIWQATKDFMTFGLINIGDPVVSLKAIPKKLPGTEKTRKYDATIWYLISKDEDNLEYDVFDYNNDGNDDVIILKRWGYIQLLEGTNVFWDYLDRGNLVYLADISTKSPIIAWDFSGDGFSDIVLLNKDRKIIFLSNTQKDFRRIETNISLRGLINQIVGFDMDLDGIKDLVILDDMWDLSIFYGTPKEWVFTKKSVDSGLWVILSEKPRKDLGAIYYDGLYQIARDKSEENLIDSEALLKKLEENKNNLSSSQTGSQSGVNEALVDKLIFTQMNYTPASARWKNDGIVNGMPDSIMTPEMMAGIQNQEKSVNDIIKTFSWTSQTKSPDLWDDVAWVESGIQDAKTWVQNLFDTYQNDESIQISSTWTQLSNDLTTFLKSEYGEFQWIDIQKTYYDLNDAPLRWWDNVELVINIKNNSAKPLRDFAYVEKIYNMFSISSTSKYSLQIWEKSIAHEDVNLLSSPSSEFSFLLDSYYENDQKKYITLLPGETLQLKITLSTKSFQYGHIDVWFFDDQTEHWDIIFKDKNETCGQEVWLYKSIAKRDYEKTIHAPSCENTLPEEIEDNAVDTDGNGIPDYIDALINGTGAENIENLQNYAEEHLNDFNSDVESGDDEDFMNSLDKINGKVDDILAGIDTILAGLSCGFWGWGCISMPLNWAPLAPWNDPTLFGMPIWDGLRVWEWLPIFSAMNWQRVGKVCVPMAWPPAIWLPGCFWMWAGWRLGTFSPTNFIRVFVTPTLTGAVGVAVCFWAPPIVAGYSNPPGLHPFVPWWNCVVAATPVFGCKNDGSDGEIYNLWNPNDTIINGNCSWNNTSTTPYLWEVGGEYVDYKNTGSKSPSLDMDLKEILSTVASWPSQRWSLPNDPLLNIWNSSNPDLSVDIDFWALSEWNFEDVLDVRMKRISPFPDFVMEWVTRQIEEIANKLTDFPTLYIILPDFNGIFDNDWGGYFDKFQSVYKAWEEKAKQEQASLQNEIANNSAQLEGLDCEENTTECLSRELEISKLKAQKNLSSNQTVGGIQAVYEFLSSMPMVKIEPQKVYFNIPWPGDKASIDKAIADFEATKLQRQQEIERAKWEWNIENYNCVASSTSQECKNMLNMQGLISSIDQNISILKWYKNIPEDIYKMLKIKDIRIEQILCNIETISKITGGRIWENGKRFKAWVELYVLIKAILKSWQLLVDVFIDYDAACHQCKNERYDLLYFVWKLVSMVIPKIPVIQFPKWPDIYLDLHNIRVSLVIGLPEFEFNLRPIVLPTLPNLYLPNSPSARLNLPRLPLLPEFDLPTLPDLPSLPTIELPNLPPPPKLPKLLSAIEAFLNILKIITKVMCILKTSPFVPEWRAWDQIAFITERSGYLGIDFLDMSLPQFSFPFVDAIKVSTFVNLEFEVEFLVEMARQMALPINVFGNNIANMLNIWLEDVDFRGTTPEDINVDIERDGNVETSFQNNKKTISLFDLAGIISENIIHLYAGIEKNSKIELSNTEFKNEILKQLPNIENEKILWVWKDALKYSFNKEDSLIQDLILNNQSKYQEVQSILQAEKESNIELLGTIERQGIKNSQENILIQAPKNEKFREYNLQLNSYNKKSLDALNNLFTEDSEVAQIKKDSQEILTQVQTGIETFSQKLNESKTMFEKVEISGKNLMAMNTGTPSQPTPPPRNEMSANTPWTPQSTQSCQMTSNGYSYIYKWIYIVEKFLNKKISYYLFDYLDELSGKEVIKERDFDGDDDEDIIYMMGDEIYLKQNHLNKKQNKDFYSGSPMILPTSKNKYLQWNFISWVNNFEESVGDSNFINVSFDAKQKQNNYRLEFYPIVDKFDDRDNSDENYIPKNVKKYIIDGFSDIDKQTWDIEKTSQDSVTIRKNLASIQAVGNMAWVHLYTKELIDISNDISSNTQVTINAGTKIYSWKESVKIRYYFYKDRAKELKMKEIKINSWSNISFKEDIIVVWLVWDAYVEGKNFVTLSGNKIAEYIKKPLLIWSILTYKDLEIPRRNTYVTLQYYDNTQTLLDFEETAYYELYNLWNAANSYSIRSEIKNDYYYAKIRTFKNNLFSTYSAQTLLSPQNESDTTAPEISNISHLRIPVYSQKIFDISTSLFENSGNYNIKEISIDFDLERDSDGDGNKINDKDFISWNKTGQIKITKEGTRVLLQIGPFNELINKPIRLSVVDANHNKWVKNINFIIYSPIPKIALITQNKISWNLDEALTKIPVSFYRLRNNELTRLIDKNKNNSTYTIEWWKFWFDVWNNISSGAIVSYSWETLFTLNENTGKIHMSDISKIRNKLSISVNSNTNEYVYPNIIVSKENTPLFYQYLVTPNTQKVQSVSHLSEVIEGSYKSKVGVYYMHQASNNFWFVSLPLWLANNSGDLYIYASNDTKKTPIFTLFKDGRISVVWDLYYLEYGSYGEYVTYNLKRKWMETIIGRVLIIPEENYIVK